MISDSLDLASKAKELENHLRGTLKCYVIAGWMKDPDVGTVYTVYVDKRAHVRKKDIPNKWYGMPVFADEVMPPGSSKGRI